MCGRQIRAKLEGSVGEIALARPETRNAMTLAMGAEVERAVADANARPDLRVLLVRGDGQGFSAGGDFAMLQERAGATEAENRRVMRQFYASFLAIRRVRVPTIAIMHGAAVGAGLCFALACDMRLASADATLSANFARVGLHPGMGATWLLPRLVGPAKTAELLFGGETLNAHEAHRIGLINQVVPPGQLDEHARALCERICAGGPHALALTKATLTRADEASLETALDQEAEAQARSFSTADVNEALRALAEKRRPIFRGE
jgi:enoyl-CoA hydratase/carnithine racemase